MNVKEYLKNYRNYRDLVKYLDRRIAEKRKTCLTHDEYQRELNDRKYFDSLVADIDRAIVLLRDPVEQHILRLRYVEGWSWTKVCLAIHYSRTQTNRIHVRALEHLEEITLREGLLWEE